MNKIINDFKQQLETYCVFYEDDYKDSEPEFIKEVSSLSEAWEIGQKNYNEKIRFIITFSPKILVNLFNRKWF